MTVYKVDCLFMYVLMGLNTVLSRSCRVCVVWGGRLNIWTPFSWQKSKHFKETWEASSSKTSKCFPGERRFWKCWNDSRKIFPLI
jgi:hypothetical protein